jgi:hypothetical protein
LDLGWLDRVYLDQNKWIDLAKAASGHPDHPKKAHSAAARP